jgi:hypothetical protein
MTKPKRRAETPDYKGALKKPIPSFEPECHFYVNDDGSDRVV